MRPLPKLIALALTLATLGLSGKNYEQVRSLDVWRDGNLALLYDRRERGRS